MTDHRDIDALPVQPKVWESDQGSEPDSDRQESSGNEESSGSECSDLSDNDLSD